MKVSRVKQGQRAEQGAVGRGSESGKWMQTAFWRQNVSA